VLSYFIKKNTTQCPPPRSLLVHISILRCICVARPRKLLLLDLRSYSFVFLSSQFSWTSPNSIFQCTV
jgi:hypothetical protein